MKEIKRYFKFWFLMSRNAFLGVLHSKGAFGIFLFGKIVRFGFSLMFLAFLIKGAGGLGQYKLHDAIFFFLTFTFVDVVSQFLFREVYRFRPMIINGDFDLVLAKPINSLFRVLLGGADIIDFVTIPPIVAALIYYGISLQPSLLNVVLYLLLLVNSLLIATAFHILIVALAILTLEADHIVWVYRDLTSLGRFPIDIYRQPLQGILTYLVPIGIMFTFPAKALLNVLSPMGIGVSFVVSFVIMFVVLRFWKLAIKQYTSASS